jgi:hypothetical protein
MINVPGNTASRGRRRIINQSPTEKSIDRRFIFSAYNYVLWHERPVSPCQPLAEAVPRFIVPAPGAGRGESTFAPLASRSKVKCSTVDLNEISPAGGIRIVARAA